MSLAVPSRAMSGVQSMAKASFHKNQRVFVKPVGTWALIERVVPQWAKGVEEPIKVTYDCGLGREFVADELQTEELASTRDITGNTDQWRLIRGQNKWHSAEECAHHPFPGTYPIVVTSERDWGGWRVPSAEYDLDPMKVESQARIIAHSITMVDLLRKITDYAEESPGNLPNQLMDLVGRAREVVRQLEN